MKEQGKKRPRADGQEAAVWVPRQPGARHVHVKKHQQRDKGLEVVFDPKAHKEYLTGFHKRKVARRKEALKKLEKRQREQRLEERAERRQAMKEEIARLGADVSDSEDGRDEDGAAAVAPEQRVYTKGELTSTVTVMPIRTHSDSEDDGSGGGWGSQEEEEDEQDEEEGGGQAAGRQQHHQPRWQREQQQQSEGHQPQAHGRKLSKTALRIMTKTKLKVEGKRAGGSGKGGKGGKKGGKGGGSGGGKRGGKGGGRGGRR